VIGSTSSGHRPTSEDLTSSPRRDAATCWSHAVTSNSHQRPPVLQPADSTNAQADHCRTRRGDEPGIIDEGAGPRTDAGFMDRRRLRSTVLEDRPFVRTAGSPPDQRVPAAPAGQFEQKTRGRLEMAFLFGAIRQSQTIWPFPQVSYSIRIPLIARAITNCWICSVPSKMS
jgi:hypothetical protein